MNEYNAEKHEYKIDCEPVLSVTQVLKKVGIVGNFDIVPDEIMTNAILRGRSVHKHCQLFEDGLIDKYATDPGSMKCVEQWLDLRKIITVRHGEPKSTWCEKPLYSRCGRYAGTPDIVFVYTYFAIICDWKTGIDTPGVEVQLAAYSDLVYDNLLPSKCKIICYHANLWHDKSRGKLVQHSQKSMDAADTIWRSALNITQYLKNRK